MVGVQEILETDHLQGAVWGEPPNVEEILDQREGEARGEQEEAFVSSEELVTIWGASLEGVLVVVAPLSLLP